MARLSARSKVLLAVGLFGAVLCILGPFFSFLTVSNGFRTVTAAGRDKGGVGGWPIFYGLLGGGLLAFGVLNSGRRRLAGTGAALFGVLTAFYSLYRFSDARTVLKNANSFYTVDAKLGVAVLVLGGVILAAAGLLVAFLPLGARPPATLAAGYPPATFAPGQPPASQPQAPAYPPLPPAAGYPQQNVPAAPSVVSAPASVYPPMAPAAEAAPASVYPPMAPAAEAPHAAAAPEGGAAAPRYCAQCGTPHDAAAAFCERCGARVGPSEAGRPSAARQA